MRYRYTCDMCDAVFGSERGVHERCVSDAFNDTEATTKHRRDEAIVSLSSSSTSRTGGACGAQTQSACA